MTFAEMSEIARMLRASYRILADKESIEVWYTHLKEFDFSLAKEAVTDYLMGNPKIPTIADIVNGCKLISQMRRPKIDPNARTVRCPHCRDTGTILTESPNGILEGRPCTACGLGRIRHPWDFLSQEEKQAWLEEEAKKGRRHPTPHVASDEFYLEYTGWTREQLEARRKA